uniref:Cilia- and flagella-associated protein 53 n=1 Tax=Pyramimonas obovata TaxID=1411642 RepID=A0A7S0N3H2_9CHLO|mmetsp:Transcript_181/g.466  ORF Transcript_181/g.466 Transcript_181/m.466 type:complete len:486 (+) Transcript_181:223-1680(+)|eukprot:CAMPEP_0118926378 /NCGR_PEP_ID=MMETSP1169-20130426/4078_1 /TAXON_ID=36882 /ORGANISM="Pyramimonas obovata, Strain CCMP722" /LENGTH=485 /DNA_ID=CAMNT_0006867917 /DNA_START=154 /DNA_END=1611 /DNA_ORIENTATION=-
MMLNAVKKPRPDARILKMRAKEEQTQGYCDHVKHSANVHALASWENRTDAVIKRNIIMQRYEQLNAQAEADLDMRRQRLAAKLSEEEIDLQIELKRSQESSDSRREKMMERAKELYEERETERRRVADEALYRHWREGCDPLRAEDMKKIVRNTVAARQIQLDEKRQLKELKAQEEKFYSEMYEHERLKKEQRHIEDKQRRKELDAEANRLIDLQIKDVQQRRVEFKEEARKDAEEMKVKFAQLEEETKREEELKLLKMKQNGEELLRLNIEMMGNREREAKKEADLDAAIVANAVFKAKQEEEAEAEKRHKAQEESRQYRKHLMAMMQKEAEDTGERDRLIREQEEEYQRRRDQQEEEANAKRKALLDEVLETRQAQIDEKVWLNERAMKEQAHERAHMASEMHRIAEQEKEYTHMVHMQRLQNMIDIQAQMRQKENMKAKERMEAERAQMGVQEAERVYMNMVMNDTSEPPRWFGRKKHTWYH